MHLRALRSPVASSELAVAPLQRRSASRSTPTELPIYHRGYAERTEQYRQQLNDARAEANIWIQNANNHYTSLRSQGYGNIWQASSLTTHNNSLQSLDRLTNANGIRPRHLEPRLALQRADQVESDMTTRRSRQRCREFRSALAPPYTDLTETMGRLYLDSPMERGVHAWRFGDCGASNRRRA